jgi:dipeptidase
MCDSIVDVTDDGVLFAKNSDRDANESQFLEWVAAARHDVTSPLKCTWIEISQVELTNAVLLSRPWWMWGAEMGANEHGLVIGNEAVFTTAGKGDPALLGMDLVRLALERASDIDGAAEVIVNLLERYGQGGPCSHEKPGFTYDNSFLIADRDGAMVLETAGREWATDHVRHGVRTISNALSIPAFSAAHSDRLRTAVAGGRARQLRTQSASSGSHGPAALMRALRDHGPNGAPSWSRLNGTLRAPCVHAGGVLASSQTTASMVSDLRGGVRHWVTGTSAPCTSTFKQVSVGDPVDLGPPPTNVFDAATLWWRHERVHRTMARDLAGQCASFATTRDELESSWIADPPGSLEAFRQAAQLEESWLAAHGQIGDRRPAWVRRTWRELDQRAQMPRAAGW